MVDFKSLIALSLLGCEALAIQIHYAIDYKGPMRRTRNSYGISVTREQATRIKENMYTWSQGHYTASENAGMLVVRNTHVIEGYASTTLMLENMQATVQYYVRGAGASGGSSS